MIVPSGQGDSTIERKSLRLIIQYVWLIALEGLTSMVLTNISTKAVMEDGNIDIPSNMAGVDTSASELKPGNKC